VSSNAFGRSGIIDTELQQMSATVKGYGLFNRAINAFELHITGYRFCGPGTYLEKRLARGDPGINSLDAACREHEIAYSRSNNLTERCVVNRILAEKNAKTHRRERFLPG